MRILHLSDLHFSATNDDQIIVLNALFEDLRRKATEKPIDMIVFTGDLVAKGDFTDKTAESINKILIQPLLSASGVSADKFFLIPGNHDVNQKKRDDFYNPIVEACTSEEKVSDLIKKMDSHDQLLSQMSDFTALAEKIVTAVPVHNDSLCSSCQDPYGCIRALRTNQASFLATF